MRGQGKRGLVIVGALAMLFGSAGRASADFIVYDYRTTLTLATGTASRGSTMRLWTSESMLIRPLSIVHHQF
jgi:hypothetical protein